MLQKLGQRLNRREHLNEVDVTQDDCRTQNVYFYSVAEDQNNQTIDLQENLEYFCNSLPVLGSTSAICYFH